MYENDGNLSPNPILGDLFLALPSLVSHHKPGSKVYPMLKQVARREIETLFSDKEPQAKVFGPFGEIIFPYFKMEISIH
jgi:hypothetical protein